jgi:tetratricopeptide (TPR) repeat protein
MELQGFTAAESRAFLQARGRVGGDDWHRFSGGNPLVLTEMVLNGTAKADSFEELVRGRLAGLGGAELTALQAGAVLGRTFAHDVWQAVVGQALPVRALIEAQFLQEDGDGYQFKHDLVRGVVLAEMPAFHRTQLHTHIGDILAGRQGDSATIAWHFAQAHAYTQAIRHFREAGEKRLALGDVVSARKYYSEATALLPNVTVTWGEKLRLDCLALQLEQIESWSSANDAKARWLETQAEQLGDGELLLKVLQTRLTHSFLQGQLAEVSALCERIRVVAQGLEDWEVEIRAFCFIARRLLTVFKDAEQGIPFAKRAVFLADKMRHLPALLLEARLALIANYLTDRQVSPAQEQLALAEHLFDLHPELAPMQAQLRTYQALVAQLLGDSETAFAHFEQLITIYERTQAYSGLQVALYNGAHLAMMMGQHERARDIAEKLLRHVLQLSQQGDQYWAFIARAMLTECYTMAGNMVLAEEMFTALLHWLNQGNEGHGGIYGWTVAGIFYFYQGNYAAAYDATKRVLTLAEKRGTLTTSPLLTHAETAHFLGKSAEAQEMMARVKEMVDPKAVGNNQVYFHYVDYLLTGEMPALIAARDMMFTLANRLHNVEVRRSYLVRLPLHEDIRRHWGAHGNGLRLVTLGEQNVMWVVDDGEKDAGILQKEGKVGLRHHRLRRLLAEAEIQRVGVSSAVLANALGVSARTIERDLRTLALASDIPIN